MKHLALLLWLAIFASLSIAQVKAPDTKPDTQTQEILIGCVMQDAQAPPLTLENLSAKNLTLVGLSPLGEKPFNYVLVYDRSSVRIEQANLNFGYNFKNTTELHRGEFYLSRLMLHSLTRIGKDRGGAVFFAKDVGVARGFTTNADQILSVAETIHPDYGSALFDALDAGIKKLDEIENGGPRFLFVVSIGENYQSRLSQLPVEEKLLSSRTHVIAISVGSWVVEPSTGYQFGTRAGIRRDPTDGAPTTALHHIADRTGGWFLRIPAEATDAETVANNRREFDKLGGLFRNWYLLQVKLPTESKGSVPLNLKTDARCKLVAPSHLVVSTEKRR
jgi:hypothetical protein